MSEKPQKTEKKKFGLPSLIAILILIGLGALLAIRSIDQTYPGSPLGKKEKPPSQYKNELANLMYACLEPEGESDWDCARKVYLEKFHEFYGKIPADDVDQRILWLGEAYQMERTLRSNDADFGGLVSDEMLRLKKEFPNRPEISNMASFVYLDQTGQTHLAQSELKVCLGLAPKSSFCSDFLEKK